MTTLNRREAALAMLGAAVAPGFLRGATRPAGTRPNLLFLITDQQRADTLAAYGNHRFHLPNMNRLGAESVVFERCYTAQPICGPSRSALLTGRWPHAAGVLSNSGRLRTDTKVFPELLANPDYKTGYFGEWHLGDEVFAQHGFQDWISMEDGYQKLFSDGRDKNAISDYAKHLAAAGFRPDSRDGKTLSREAIAKLPLECRKSNFLAAKSSEFILRNQRDPWVLFVSFMDPHVPFHGPLNDAHTAEEAPLPPNYPGFPIEREPRFYRSLREKYQKDGYKAYRALPGHDLKNRESFQRLARNYAGLCSEADGAFGRILWALEATGQRDNTIVVHTSDHGEMMGAHGLIGKEVMYEESIRVPLTISVPFRTGKPVRVSKPVSTVDIVPTLLELMGSKAAESIQGQSLIPAMNGGPLKRSAAVIEWNREEGDEASESSSNGRTMVTADGWKLVLYAGDDCMLFDRKNDPLEMNNLYYRPESTEVVKRLRGVMEKWQRDTGDTLAF